MVRRGVLEDALEALLGRQVDLVEREAVEASRISFAAAAFWPRLSRFGVDESDRDTPRVLPSRG